MSWFSDLLKNPAKQFQNAYTGVFKVTETIAKGASDTAIAALPAATAYAPVIGGALTGGLVGAGQGFLSMGQGGTGMFAGQYPAAYGGEYGGGGLGELPAWLIPVVVGGGALLLGLILLDAKK